MKTQELAYVTRRRIRRRALHSMLIIALLCFSRAPRPPQPPTDFAAAWEAFFRATRRARGRSTGPLSEGGLSLAQYHLLESLLDGRERTVSELALAAGVAAPTATRMLDCLVRDGHAARRPSEHDRRAVLVSLTELRARRTCSPPASASGPHACACATA